MKRTFLCDVGFHSMYSRGFLFWAMIETVILLMVVVLPGYGEETSVTMVNCAACRYVSWPRDTWECDVKCNVAPTGVLTYGK